MAWSGVVSDPKRSNRAWTLLAVTDSPLVPERQQRKHESAAVYHREDILCIHASAYHAAHDAGMHVLVFAWRRRNYFRFYALWVCHDGVAALCDCYASPSIPWGLPWHAHHEAGKQLTPIVYTTWLWDLVRARIFAQRCSSLHRDLEHLLFGKSWFSEWLHQILYSHASDHSLA